MRNCKFLLQPFAFIISIIAYTTDVICYRGQITAGIFAPELNWIYRHIHTIIR